MATAWLIFMLPHSIITVSLVTVFYPRMSEHAAAGDTAALRDDVRQALRIVLLVLVVADAALLAAAVPFAAVFSQSQGAASATGLVLVAYLIGLLPFTALFVVQRCFYALADTRTPFRFTLVQVAVVTAGTLLCALLPVQLRAAAIALVVSLAGAVQLVIAVRLLRRRIGAVGGPELRASLTRYLVAGAPALVVGLAVLALVGGFGGGWAVAGRVNGVLATALIGVVVAAVYLAALALQKAPELGVATRILTDRFGSRSRAEAPSRAE
jgi:putative peptidoglycan lipid II flippase